MIKIKDPIERKCELLYYVTLFLYLSLLFAVETELIIRLSPMEAKLLQMGRYGCYLLFFIKIIAYPLYQRRYFLSIIIIMVCATMCAFISTTRTILFMMLAVVAAYDCDARKILKIATSVFGIGLAITVLLCMAGIFENRILNTVRMRHNLGFNWVTLAPIYFFFVSIGYTLWRGEDLTLPEALTMEAISVVLFLETDARLTFLVNTLFLLYYVIQKYIFKFSWYLLRAADFWLCIIPLALFVIVLIVQILYKPGNSIWDMVNGLLSGRLQQTKGQLDTLSITPFGQAIDWFGYSLGEGFLEIDDSYVSNNVDSSYLRILLDYGVIGLLITLALYVIGIYKAVKAEEYGFLWAYIIVLLFCVTEQWIIQLSFNPFPLFALASFEKKERSPSACVRGKKIIFQQV